MFWADRKERSRFLRFAFVGVIGAVLDFGIFNLLLATTAIAAIWASAISFSAAVVSNFTWNRYWTYPDSRSKPLARQLLMFIIVSLIGMGIRIGLFAVLEIPMIKMSAALLPPGYIKPTFVGHNLTLAIAVLIVMLWNFLANRYWTYNDVN